MRDYARDAVALYMKVSGLAKLRRACTPFVPEGSISHADSCDPGEVAPKACSVLMKALWLARLARPDIQKPIGDLATNVQCWSRAEDKKLYRLICYLNTTAHYRLVGRVNDPAEHLHLVFLSTQILQVIATLRDRRPAVTWCWPGQTHGSRWRGYAASKRPTADPQLRPIQ